MQRSLARRSNGPGVVDIFTEIRTVIDAGNHHVRLLRHESVQRNNDAIRRRPVDRPLSLADLVANNRLPQRQRLRRPLRSRLGATMLTVAMLSNAFASVRRPSAW